MTIYLLRHAIAVPRGHAGYPGDDRPLTAKGRERMQRNAAGMKRLGLEFDHIFVSPLSRSRETGVIVQKRVKTGTPLAETDDLMPDSDPSAIVGRLSTLGPEDSVLLVGHEPHLGRLAATLIDAPLSSILFRKGGLCRIDIRHPVRKSGTLIWHLTPAQLRIIGRKG